jgi:hypothetical protein
MLVRRGRSGGLARGLLSFMRSVGGTWCVSFPACGVAMLTLFLLFLVIAASCTVEH